MIRWVILWVSLILITPVAVYASDESEGEISAAEVGLEEAAHEQIEALRLRAEKENEIAEIQAEAKREEEQSQVEAQAAEAKAVYEHASKSTFAPTVKSGNSQ